MNYWKKEKKKRRKETVLLWLVLLSISFRFGERGSKVNVESATRLTIDPIQLNTPSRFARKISPID